MSLNWGILSTGRIAAQFAQDFEYVEGAHITAVASRKQETADAFAKQHGIETAYGSYEALIEAPDIDVVYVATPHSLHLQNCLAAMAAGKAVLCEKPITISAAECAELIEAQRSSGCYLMEAMWTHFLPAIRRAIEWVRDGRIGSLVHIKADFGYPQFPYHPERREYNADLGGGALLELGIYPLALSWLVTGVQPVLRAVEVKRAPNGVEDDVVILADYGTVTATLATSYRCKLQNWAYLIGTDGYVAIPDFWRAKTCLLYRLDALMEEFVDDSPGVGFHHEARAVVSDLEEGNTQSQQVPLSASLAWQRHIDSIKAY